MKTSLPKVGAYEGIASEEYHAWPAASSTVIRAIARSSPAHSRVGPDPDSPSLRLGTAVHAAVLEPAKFDGMVRVEPKVDKRTKDGKALWESWQMSLMPGQVSISEEQMQVVDRIAANVRHSRACTAVLGLAPKREWSVVAEVEGVMCKCRCDAYGPGLVVDVKTSSGLVGEQDFAKTIWNYQYAMQAAFYRMVLDRAGFAVDRFVWIACETAEPNAVAVYQVGPDVLDHFEEPIVQALRQYADCEHVQAWPAYPDVIKELELPPWMRRQMEASA